MSLPNNKIDEKIRLKGNRCRICYLSTMDPDVREIIDNPDISMKKKSEGIQDLHRNWKIHYASVRNHLIQNHKDTIMLKMDQTGEKEEMVSTKEVMSWMLRRGLDGLRRRKKHDDIDAKTLLEIRKLELEERKLDIAEKGGTGLNEFARLMQQSQYGVKKDKEKKNGPEGIDQGTD